MLKNPILNPFTFPSTVVLLDEEDEEGEDEDLNEEDLDIGTEDPDSPPTWEMYCDIDDNDDSNEDTALLRAKAARTEIVITPISPVRKTAKNKLIYLLLLISLTNTS